MKISATFRKVERGLVLRLEPREYIESFTLDFIMEKLHFSVIPSCYQGIDSVSLGKKEKRAAFAEYDIKNEERGKELIEEIRARIKNLGYKVELAK